MLVCNEDSDADIKMYVVHRENWKSKTLCENLVECPECAKDFNTISELKTHNRDFNFSCHRCGKCFKKSERPHSAYCLPEDSFEKKDTNRRAPCIAFETSERVGVWGHLTSYLPKDIIISICEQCIL